MVRQQHTTSCGAACVCQLLLDAGLNVTEAIVCQHAGFVPGRPLSDKALVKALRILHPGAVYLGGAVDPDVLVKLAARGSFLALLNVSRNNNHWVIVEEVSGFLSEGLVSIRDPAGCPQNVHVGAKAIMAIDDFRERWRLATTGVVFRDT
jgi:hypothetical protein